MKQLALILLMLSSQPAWAQMKLTPKDVGRRADNCAPIGRTDDGRLVYSMKCETLPARAAPALAPQAEVKPGSSPEAASRSDADAETTERSGLFGMSFARRPR